jgi:hypothetical protein
VGLSQYNFHSALHRSLGREPFTRTSGASIVCRWESGQRPIPEEVWELIQSMEAERGIKYVPPVRVKSTLELEREASRRRLAADPARRQRLGFRSPIASWMLQASG